MQTVLKVGLGVFVFVSFISFFCSFLNKNHMLRVYPLKSSGSPVWTIIFPNVLTILDCINLSTCMKLNRNL